MKFTTLVAICLAAGVGPLSAQAPVVIDSLDLNGKLTWTDADNQGAHYDVQWSSDLTTWHTDMSSLTGIQMTGPTQQVLVPRFFRVVKRRDVDDPDLVAFYPFDGSFASAVGSWTGTPSGNPRTIGRGADKALEMDGVDDFVSLPDFGDFTSATVCGWVKWDNFGFFSRFFDFGLENQSFHVFHFENSDRLGYDLQFEDETNVDVRFQIQPSVWYHVAMTLDSIRGASVYVNGKLEGFSPSLRETFKDLPAKSTFYLGKSSFPADSLLKGGVDNVRIYKRSLTESEIAGIYSRERQ